MSLVRRIARKHSSGPQQLQTQKIPKKTFNDSDLEDEFTKEVEKSKIIDKELLDLDTKPREKKKRKPREKKEPKEKVEDTDPNRKSKNVTLQRRFGSGITCAEEIAKLIHENGNKPVSVNDMYDMFGDRIKEVFPNAKSPKANIYWYFNTNRRNLFIRNETSPATFHLNMYTYENLDNPDVIKSKPRKKKKVETVDDESEETPKRKMRERKVTKKIVESEDESEDDSDNEEIKATERKEEDEIEMIY